MRDRQFIPLKKEKQKLTYDDEIKTFIQCFNKQREINLTKHAKRRYIHGIKNSSVYKRMWRHVVWQMIITFSDECASPESGQRKVDTSGFSETFVTIYQAIWHESFPQSSYCDGLLKALRYETTKTCVTRSTIELRSLSHDNRGTTEDVSPRQRI
jgi:hypothetical protein